MRRIIECDDGWGGWFVHDSETGIVSDCCGEIVYIDLPDAQRVAAGEVVPSDNHYDDCVRSTWAKAQKLPV